MKWGRGPAVLALALLALSASPALAADQLIKGTRLILKAICGGTCPVLTTCTLVLGQCLCVP